MDPKKAFNYEQGQFICHPFARLADEICETFSELVGVLKEESQQNSMLKGWRLILTEDDCDVDLNGDNTWHLTLLRGHRAIHRHQIKALVSSIQTECTALEPFNLCLDSFDVYTNFEQTKQFLVITERKDNIQQPAYLALKSALRAVIDKFAIKLTDEDETDDTRAHCSLMMKDIDQGLLNFSQDERRTIVQLVDRICLKNFNQIPICVTRVDRIHIKIGNHVYDVRLGL